MILVGLLDIICPSKWRRVKSEIPPWCQTPEIRNIRKLRDYAHCRAIKENDAVSWREYRRVRNRATSMLRSSKSNYISELAKNMKSQPSKFWDKMSYLTSKKVGSDVTGTADEFNNYFLSIPHQIVADVPAINISPTSFIEHLRDVPTFLFSHVSKEEVYYLIRDLNTRKATGADQIPPFFIKRLRLFLLEPITEIVNRSLDQCVFPKVWKQANVIPIQKKSGDISINNFRPISILPIMSKILERIVHFQLLNHLTQFNLLSEHQSGFRPGFSTQDVLIHVTDSWRRAADKGKYVGAIFVDFAKAFDTVDHSVLLSKLPFYGIRDRPLLWMKHYLSDRHQRVCIENDMSEWGEVTIGVPQGSILGPLLFILYINDLPTVIKNSEVNIYADDTEIHSSSTSLNSLNSQLQDDLNEIST